MMSFRTFAFSAQGRVNRAKYWGGSLAFLFIYLLASAPFYFLVDPPPGGATDVPAAKILAVAVIVMATLALFWAQLCLAIKRLHDRNKSGWWYLIAFIPYIGGFWLLVDCGILRGTSGPNRYGPDPLGGYGDAIGRVFEA